MIHPFSQILELFLQRNEIHHHSVGSDLALQPEVDDVTVPVETGAFLMLRNEVAGREPDARMSTVNL